MFKQHIGKVIFSTCAMLLVASAQVQAVDVAAANGVLAKVGVMVVQAKASLAEAAGTGNVAATAEAAKRAMAVDSAMAEAQVASDAVEAAAKNGDEAAAKAAENALAVAYQKAVDALNGTIPVVAEKTDHEKWIEAQTNTGGGPGASYDPPNIYNKPWHTQGLSQFYQSVWGTFQRSTGGSGSGGFGFGDSDATPE